MVGHKKPISTGSRVRERRAPNRAGEVKGAVGRKRWRIRFDGETEDTERSSAQLTQICENDDSDPPPTSSAPSSTFIVARRKPRRRNQEVPRPTESITETKEEDNEDEEGADEEPAPAAPSTSRRSTRSRNRQESNKSSDVANECNESDSSIPENGGSESDSSNSSIWNDESGVGSALPCNGDNDDDDHDDDDDDNSCAFQASASEEESGSEEEANDSIIGDDGTDDSVNSDGTFDSVVVADGDEEEDTVEVTPAAGDDDDNIVNPFAASADFEPEELHRRKTEWYKGEKEKLIRKKKTFVITPNRTAKVEVGDKVKMKDSPHKNKIGTATQQINKQKWLIVLDGTH